MSKEQQQIIDKAYENYVKSFFKGERKKNYEGGGYDIDDYYYSIINIQHLLGWPQDGPVSKEEFINKCKTDNEFSEKWGLKIEERELSVRERLKLVGCKDDVVIESVINHKGEEFHKNKMDKQNIPTKLITITYNKETIESYE